MQSATEVSAPAPTIETPRKEKVKKEKAPKAPREVRELAADEAEVYCVACRTHKIIKSPTVITNKKNVKMHQGVCPDCGNRANRFIRNPKPEDAAATVGA